MANLFVKYNISSELKNWFNQRMPQDRVEFSNWGDLNISEKGIIFIFNPGQSDFAQMEARTELSDFKFIIASDDLVQISNNIKLLDDSSRVMNIIDLNWPEELISINLKSLLGSKVSSVNFSAPSVGAYLNEFVTMSLKQMHQVKKIHEKLVPVREESSKGVYFYSKYAAGVASGGEYFDFIKKGNDLGLFVTMSDSYVLSSSVLTIIEEIRSLPDLTDSSIKNAIGQLSNEVKNLTIDGRGPVLDLMFIKIDGNTLKAQVFNFGQSLLITNFNKIVGQNDYPVDLNFIDQGYREIQLERDEKMVVLSPGVQKNTNGFLNNLNLIDFIQEGLKEDSKALLQEIFYQMKKDIKGSFLDFDASVLLLEVDNNVIISV